MESEIFISYCRKDIAKAKRLKDEIEKSTSAKCWMDLDGIESGSQFEDVIISAIDNARIVVFLLSENSMQSKWTKDEVRYAYETRKKIVPVNIDNCTPSGWFLFKFSGFDVIDVNDSFQRKKLFENLIEWTDKNPPEKEEVFVADHSKQRSNRLYDFFNASQYVLWGVIIIAMSSMFFYGLLTMKEGSYAMRYNILLCMCLCLSLYSFYLLFVKKKKKAFYLVCILDVLEIILLCAVSKRVAGYALTNGYHYRSFLYIRINGLGWEMINRGGLLVTVLMESFAIIHMLVLFAVLYIRISGYRLWDCLK